MSLIERILTAIGYHHTGTTDSPWDAGAATKRLREGESEEYYSKVFAWRDPSKDPKTKAAYKFPHHEVSENGEPGAANLVACSAVIAVLNGGRGGADIPDGDRSGVHAHVAHHLEDAGQKPPPLKALEPEDARKLPATDAKALGTKDKPIRKVWEISQLKVSKSADGVVTLMGYANTKGHADRYGDVPTVYKPLRNYVYELSDFVRNPVLLMNHDNSVQSIAGSFTKLAEDEQGLAFEAAFSQSDYAPVAHARTVYAEGHGKALSIAGRFYFEDKDHPENLTYADIMEISLVGVGADPNALGYAEQPLPKAAVTADDAAEALAAVQAAEAGAQDLETAGKALEELGGKLDAVLLEADLSAELGKLGQALDRALA